MNTEKEQAYLDRIAELEKELKRTYHKIKKDTYGLHWLDVPEVFEDDVENKLPILKEVKDKAIVNDDSKPTHILIEGDNYHALTCLNYTHKGKIDLIYIDPPYNTGKDGFRYKDKRILKEFPDGSEVPKDHPLRHSYWLSFMFKRLELANKLLKDEGVIFISINEEEHSQLKLLCDQIFMTSNYLTSFTIKVRHEDRILKGDKDFHETTEQLLLYRKSNNFKTIKRIQDNTSISKYVYMIKELTDKPEMIKFGNKTAEIFKPHEYEIIKTEASIDNFQKVNIRGSIKEGNSSGRFHMKYLEERNDHYNYLYKVPNIGDDKYEYRYFLTRKSEDYLNGFYFQGVPQSREDVKEVPYPNYLDFEEAFNNVGYEGGVTFRNGKKPVDFLKFIINIGSKNKDALILDFFAGSGSTGQAVLEQNYLDHGNRQVILCTNDESNIASEVTYPRLQNIINGYKQTKNQKEILFELILNPEELTNNSKILKGRHQIYNNKDFERYDDIKEEVRKGTYTIYGEVKKSNNINGLGNSLKYYKTEFVGDHNILGANDTDKTELAHHTGEMLAIAENTLYEMEEYHTDFYQFFQNENHYTAVYFREELVQFEEFREKVMTLEKPVAVYVFSWGENEFADQFDDRDDIEVKPIPRPILEVYKTIYNLSD